jgi:hypothetical protein
VSDGMVITSEPPVGIGLFVKVIENRALKIALMRLLLQETELKVTIFVVRTGVAVSPVVS